MGNRLIYCSRVRGNLKYWLCLAQVTLKDEHSLLTQYKMITWGRIFTPIQVRPHTYLGHSRLIPHLLKAGRLFCILGGMYISPASGLRIDQSCLPNGEECVDVCNNIYL